MSNTKNLRTIKYSTIVASKAFGDGFREVKKGLPLCADKYSGKFGKGLGNLQWIYERGRQFGHLFDGPLKNGHYPTSTALNTFIDRCEDRSIL